MDLFLTYIVAYLVACGLVLPWYFVASHKIAKKKAIKENVDKNVIFGYYFHPVSPITAMSCSSKRANKSDIIDTLEDQADDFITSMSSNFWLSLSEYSKNSNQKCEEFFAHKAGLRELCIIMEYETLQYTTSMKHRVDDDEILKEVAINEAVDVLLYKTCYRTFEAQLNLINRLKAVEIYNFCKDNLSFTEPKYLNLLEMDHNITGIRRTTIS